jgi:hypothetical protein
VPKTRPTAQRWRCTAEQLIRRCSQRTPLPLFFRRAPITNDQNATAATASRLTTPPWPHCCANQQCMNANQAIRKQAACASCLSMAETREPPKKGVALVIWPMPALCAVRAHLLVRATTALRGMMEPRGRACRVSSRAGGGRMPAGAVREGRQSACVCHCVCPWQAKNRGFGVPR